MRGVRAAVDRRVGTAGLVEALAREGIAVDAADAWPVEALPVDALSIDARLVAAADLAAWLAAGDPATPIVVVDGPADPVARAALLDAGAADVLVAPADPVELAARLRALVRRRTAPPIDCGDLRVDPLARHAERGGRPLPLHPREFALLAALAQRRDTPVERMALLGTVWRQRFDPGTNIVAVTVSRLRAKVDHGFALPLIHTVGSGYMLSETRIVAGGPAAAVAVR
jgi:two-component system OmpR family response regulator